MMRCSPEAFAKCPMQKHCGSQQDATFMEGSDCDKFNKEVENMHKDIEEWISEGARPYVAMGISVAVAVTMGILAIVAAVAAFWCLWWMLAFVACGVLCGTATGIALWVYNICF